jgi:hypothetical protein
MVLPRTAHAFGYHGHIGPAGIGNIHKEMTYTALWFLDQRMKSQIAIANHHQDTNDAYKNDCSHHSCNCQFRQASDWYNSQYRKVIGLMKEPLKRSADTVPAYLFGMPLHGIQDFYAHSNWVAKYPNGLAIDFRLFDEGVGEWPRFEPYKVFNEKLMLIQGDPPRDVTVRLPENSVGRVNSAIPKIEDRRMYLSPGATPHTPPPPIINREAGTAATSGASRTRVRTPAAAAPREAEVNAAARDRSSTRVLPPTAQVRTYFGVMTAASVVDKPGQTNYPEQQCHPVGSDCKEDNGRNACLRHSESRDGTTQYAFEGAGHLNWDGGGEGDWKRARDMAKKQTTHEWCRLLNLSHQQDPSLQATGRLMTFWVPANGDPHPAGKFVCSREARRSHTVRVTVSPTGGGASIPVVMVRADFTDSKRGIVNGGRSRTLEFCANTNDRILIALTPPYAKGAGTEFGMPNAAKSWSINDRRGAWPVKYAIKVTEGCRG